MSRFQHAGGLPKGEAIIICERCLWDRNSGRYSPIGIFDQIEVESVPFGLSFSVYFATTGTGASPLFLAVQPDSGPMTVSGVAIPQSVGGNHASEGSIDFGAAPFPVFGDYYFRLFRQEDQVDCLCERLFRVLRISPSTSGTEGQATPER